VTLIQELEQVSHFRSAGDTLLPSVTVSAAIFKLEKIHAEGIDLLDDRLENNLPGILHKHGVCLQVPMIIE
jgi:hypothetical protein